MTTTTRTQDYNHLSVYVYESLYYFLSRYLLGGRPRLLSGRVNVETVDVKIDASTTEEEAEK